MPDGFFRQNLQKNGPKWKSDHNHRILHILSSLGTKFQRKLKIFNFWTKLIKNGYFQSKKKKRKMTIEFYIFELVLVLNFSFH